ncbi:MAG TPA: hypothetical protein VH589_18055 [Trebonia sp.]
MGERRPRRQHLVPPGEVITPQPGSADGRPAPGRARKPAATAVPGIARRGASAARTQSQKAQTGSGLQMPPDL